MTKNATVNVFVFMVTIIPTKLKLIIVSFKVKLLVRFIDYSFMCP